MPAAPPSLSPEQLRRISEYLRVTEERNRRNNFNPDAPLEEMRTFIPPKRK
jgi:hypothetical protein